jgi:putative phosphoribosyl transferase
MFKDRVSAGRQLAAALDKYKAEMPVVLGIPRGGVVVALEVARALGAPLDLVIPRKIGAPGNPELAIGAVAGEEQIFINSELITSLKISQSYIDSAVLKALEEIRRRRRLYMGEAEPIDPAGKTALIVDDGLATGYTALAAVQAVKPAGPARTVLAVPVAPAQTVARLSKEVDELVCLSTPEPFFAVGQFYEEFPQITDNEVVAGLKRARAA